jgi:hypothetical protein
MKLRPAALRGICIAIAKQRSAAITGVGVVDRPWATAPRAVPIGGSAYKVTATKWSSMS